jgi:hypothetical protein
MKQTVQKKKKKRKKKKKKVQKLVNFVGALENKIWMRIT